MATRTYAKLNDSSLVFLTTARIYAELHDVFDVYKTSCKSGGGVLCISLLLDLLLTQ